MYFNLIFKNELKFFKSASEESASSDEPKQSIGKFPKANAQIIDLEKRIQKVKSASMATIILIITIKTKSVIGCKNI